MSSSIGGQKIKKRRSGSESEMQLNTEDNLKTFIEEQKQMIVDKERTIKFLTDEKNKYKIECQTLKKHIKHLESELTEIRQMRQCFNNQNEMNKKMSVSNAVYGKDIPILYANERENEKNINLLGKIRNFVEEIMQESNIEGYQQIANTVENINEKMGVIISKKAKIEEKRTDGKINCGDCQRTFETTGDLKHHYKFEHKKDTTNLIKNQIEIIEITLD